VILPPDIESRYQLLERLGAGGMGEIYKVRDSRLNRVLVAKTISLPKDASSEERRELRERFRREVTLGSQLKHPNIAHIYDVSQDGSCIIMEFIDGPTVRELLQAGHLPAGLSLEIAKQTLRALGYIHRAGSIHRDISPDNLMVTQDAEGAPLIKLIDLGIARPIEETRPISQAKAASSGSLITRRLNTWTTGSRSMHGQISTRSESCSTSC
jgi:serine/threonine protein kinase